MVEQFLNHIHRHHLCKTSDKILLAVSGGVDSIVMLDLFRQAGFSIAVAHCNFQLRGEASFQDEDLVNKICVPAGIPFHLKKFETDVLASRYRKSIQVTARDLRYGFFNELCQEHGYDLVATAHNANDNIETVLINFVRGTGIEGFSGIPVKNERIIRPLLFSSRQMIMDYATSHRLTWREDASNETDDYTRNFIRHHIIPKLKEINPSLEETAVNSIERIAGAQFYFHATLEGISKELIREENARMTIHITDLAAHAYPAVILWEFLKTKGFNFDQCRDILKEHQPGKRFYSDAFQLTIDRQDLIIEERDRESDLPVVVKDETGDPFYHGSRKMIIDYDLNEMKEIPSDPNLAWLDADKVMFPLIWRNWEPGDFIMPLGMNHHKKVSDMLIDMKVPVPDKKKVTVLQSGRDIIWLVGIRINENYKVTEKTRRVMKIALSQV